MNFTGPSCALAAALAFGTLSTGPVSATMPRIQTSTATSAPMGAGTIGVATNVEKVQWRRGYHRGWRGPRPWRGRYYQRRYPLGPAIGAGIASVIIGGAIAASQRDYRSRWDECADRYRSFSWSDGTFQPYGGGPRELCPYLRG